MKSFLKRGALSLLAALAMASVAVMVSRPAEAAHDLNNADFFYTSPVVPTSSVSLVNFMTQTRTALLNGDYHYATGLIGADGGLNEFGGLQVPAMLGPSVATVIQSGTQALSAGAAVVTFGTAFGATPVCTVSDATATNAVKGTPATTTLTLAGTTTDSINWICVGNK